MSKIYSKIILSILAFALLSCSSDDSNNTLGFDVPSTYSFERSGVSTVEYTGQTQRIAMATALVTATKNSSSTEVLLTNMYTNTGNPFSDDGLNTSGKNIKSKIADSRDYFFSNSTDALAIRALLESYLTKQVTEVFSKKDVLAQSGMAGQIADGDKTRYINAKGVEYDQLFAKSLIGGLMLDQILNNYISTSVLDEGSNISNNNAGVVESGKSYTTMEHKWDEAYGYLYGASKYPQIPETDLGKVDAFLNSYLSQVNGDPDFSGIANIVFTAFKTGRAAITAKNYTERDKQANTIREKLSLIPAIRAIYYLQQGKAKLTTNKGGAFHALSEGIGFIYSLQFTRKPSTTAPYFSKTEVDQMLTQLIGGDNSLWNVQSSVLDSMSQTIAERFGITVSAASSL